MPSRPARCTQRKPRTRGGGAAQEVRAAVQKIPRASISSALWSHESKILCAAPRPLSPAPWASWVSSTGSTAQHTCCASRPSSMMLTSVVGRFRIGTPSIARTLSPTQRACPAAGPRTRTTRNSLCTVERRSTTPTAWVMCSSPSDTESSARLTACHAGSQKSPSRPVTTARQRAAAHSAWPVSLHARRGERAAKLRR